MFFTIFLSILKTFVIPIAAFLLFKDVAIAGHPIGEGNVFLAVTIAVTLSNVFSVIFKLVKILPNALLLRGNAIFKLLLRIIIEVSGIIGFWLYYFSNYR